MNLSKITVVWATGIAIFSMFFGSGNIVFPLLLGQALGDQVFWAVIGLTITAVGAPLLGLLASVLFEGDCKKFFYRIGRLPGCLLTLLIVSLLGPLGVMPRCFIVAYGAIKPYFPQLSLMMFSQAAGIIVLLFIVRRTLILPLLGFWLSPLLIATLVMIIGVAIFKMEGFPTTDYTAWQATLEGLKVGYNTMDLLASIVFSVSIWMLLKEKLNLTGEQSIKHTLVPTYIFASLIGGGLLGLIYVGMSFSAAAHPQALAGIPSEQVLAHLAIYLLGPKLAILANIAVLVACLTTVMSLSVAILDVLRIELMDTKLGKKIFRSYNLLTILMVGMTVVTSNLGFTAIMNFVGPILELCYPSIIVLAICNIYYKLYDFSYVRLPFYLTFIGTIVVKYGQALAR